MMMKNKNKEIASIENQEDYDNVLEYIKSEAQEVDIEEPYIYTEHYEIKVEKGWEKIYDEIEAFFNGELDDDPLITIPPNKTITEEGYIFNLY